MGFDYWLVHVIWTIPPAILLTAAYWPFFTRTEITQIVILINIAVCATIPWDSYLIRNRIWTYPDNAVIGITIFEIPIEEVFFFIIQTYCTSLLYVIQRKRLVLPVYLLPRSGALARRVGSAAITGGIAVNAACLIFQGQFTYLGLILIWALPVITLQWSFCRAFLCELPRKPILASILLPTFYLWIVDFVSLRRGTWVIEQGTKLDIRLGGFLDFEEAIFFLMSNVMVVFGMVAMDHAIALEQYDMLMSETSKRSWKSLGRASWSYLTAKRSQLNVGFLEGLYAAVKKLSEKSQSMYLGSAMFQDGLRVDLIFLYSFCRVLDDLVDEAPTPEKAKDSIQQASQLLNYRWSSKRPAAPLYDYQPIEADGIDQNVSSQLLSSIALLPASRLSLSPILELLAGFEMDLGFSVDEQRFPIASEVDLEQYAQRVAGTVAVSLLKLVFHHYPDSGIPSAAQEKTILAGERMGQALQYINIARDIKRDAAINRVYLPSSWLEQEGLEPRDVIENPDDPRLAKLEERMINKAEKLHESSVQAIDKLPREVRGPVKTTVESYMMIGEMVRKRRLSSRMTEEKLKVPLWRRLSLAWREMYANTY
ncbi:Bifunctional lycopene cyclase/phytoene synthase [Penicillium angulare]|uniref:Bifunctional lycopene cyclase/phytoene synthase n=1 Tax=Penicillium angulare TaxID=116970 RepID=A0A9W9G925_9EURO|nr:Bifunctional lycopene cyclase/phytoene synthase [Penicillium angulare]